MRHSVSPCDDIGGLEETDDVHKFCKDMDICDAMQLNAKTCRNWPGRTRTSNLLIQSQVGLPASHYSSSTPESDNPNPSAYPSSQTQNKGIDVILQQIIYSWPLLPEAVRAGIVVMVKVVSNR